MRRVKRAIFAFFKDEILNAVGAYVPVQEHVVRHAKLELIEIDGEIRISNDHEIYGGARAYEESLEDMKKTLFRQAEKYFTIETSSVLDPHLYNERRIKCTLYVGQPTFNN